ncbi:MAG TPA: Hpt domain-containing protein [Candidatus Methylacidiphilales bacterium]|nr:Hpt domain-containing protein [Candidatus Methylacidiphilales bacterium]
MNPHGITLDKVIPLSLERAEEAAAVRDEVDMELFPFFEQEAETGLKTVESILRDWDSGSATSPLKDLCREFHTLKGAANSIGHVRIGALAGGMKDLLDNMNMKNAVPLRLPIIKTCIFVSSTIHSLLRETHSPRFNQVKTEQIVATIQSIWRLREMAERLVRAI